MDFLLNIIWRLYGQDRNCDLEPEREALLAQRALRQREFDDQNKTPKFYIPKCDHHLEARWWNKIFTNLEQELNLPVGTLKVTFLIETLPATFQVEEILYEIKEHAAGLNVGRWDKIFSDIKVFRNHKDRIIGDRASINMTKPWMENYAKRVIKICHERGALAMGGMSAFTSGKFISCFR